MSATLKIILAMITWGSIGVFVKNIDLPSLEIAFLRAAIATVFLAAVSYRLREVKSRQNIISNKYLLLISGIALGLNWVLLFQAYRYTTIANSTLSYYMAPIIVALLAPIFFKERLTLSKLLAVLGAMAGLTVILSGQPATSEVNYNHLLGIGYGLLAALFYACVVIVNKHLKGISDFDTAFVQIAIAAIVLLPFILYRKSLVIQSADWIWIVILGIVHTGLAYLLYFSGIKKVPAHSVAVLSYIDPVAAVAFGTLFLSEPLSICSIIGGLLILGSTYWGAQQRT